MWNVDGKRCVITGATRGIGRQTALMLAGRGARIVVAGRPSPTRTAVVEELGSLGPGHSEVDLDLASLAAVRAAARRISAEGPVDLLVANAGVAGPGRLTEDGFEPSFAVNHLGHFYLAQLLRASMAGGRMVVVSSNAHFGANSDPTEAVGERAWGTGFEAYRRSKLANVLFVREAARRWSDIVSVAVHPGMVATEIWDRIPQPVRWWMTRSMGTSTDGGRRVTHACVVPTARSGAYLVGDEERDPSAMALDDDLAARVWEASLGYVRLAGPNETGSWQSGS